MTYLFGEAVSHAVLIFSLSPKMSLFLFVSKFFLLYSLTIDRPTESMRNSKTVVVFITLLLWDFFLSVISTGVGKQRALEMQEIRRKPRALVDVGLECHVEV